MFEISVSGDTLTAGGSSMPFGAWQGVADDLRRVLHGVGPLGGSLRRGALHLRLAVIGLRVALEQNRSAIAAELLRDAPEGLDPAAVLAASLEAQLGGGSATYPVLEALPSAARLTAAAEIKRALDADPDYKPALRAAAALAMAEAEWRPATVYYRRIAELPGMTETRVDALQALGTLHWRRLGEPAEARVLFERARALSPDDLVLVDKLLKLDLELERWDSAVAGCRHLVEALGDGDGNPELAVTYLLTLGEIHLYGLGEPVAALGFYLDAVERMPAYPLTYSLLQDLLEHHAEAALEGQRTSVEAGDVHAPRRQLVDLLRKAVGAHSAAPTAVRAFRDAVGFAAGA
jgi:tetratricopeptide (TPR) repeat protein